jgi:hypothetical protein
MEIDESRSDHLAVNIDRPHRRVFDPRTDADDRIPPDRDVPAIPRAAGAVDDPAVSDEQIEGRLLGARWGDRDPDQQADDGYCHETAHERLLINAQVDTTGICIQIWISRPLTIDQTECLRVISGTAAQARRK